LSVEGQSTCCQYFSIIAKPFWFLYKIQNAASLDIWQDLTASSHGSSSIWVCDWGLRRWEGESSVCSSNFMHHSHLEGSCKHRDWDPSQSFRLRGWGLKFHISASSQAAVNASDNIVWVLLIQNTYCDHFPGVAVCGVGGGIWIIDQRHSVIRSTFHCSQKIL
jgi:hypothetical protein